LYSDTPPKSRVVIEILEHKYKESDTLFLKTGEGRVYNCGTMTAVFKADENETENQ
jgi:hypothetical protein